LRRWRNRGRNREIQNQILPMDELWNNLMGMENCHLLAIAREKIKIGSGPLIPG
jgi:hypothetical protein